MRLPAALLGLALTAAAAAAQAPGEGPQTPLERFRFARQLITDGRFDIAAEVLKGFLAANPTDPDFLDIQARYNNPAIFEQLTRVRVWSDNPAAQEEAVKTVDAILQRSREANRKVYRDPQRIDRFLRNLAGTREERQYAEEQLRLSGNAVVQPLVNLLLTTQDLDLRAGLVDALRRLTVDVVPGLLAAVEGLPDDLKAAVLNSLAARPDVLSLAGAAQTDPTPWLWYYAGAPTAESPSVKAMATELLRQLIGAGRPARPADELVALSRPFYDRTAKFAPTEQVGNKVRVWAWDATARNVTAAELTPSQAEEYYGLRNLKWALQRDPNQAAARDLYLLLAAERAVERSRFGVLTQTDPAVYQLLAATPTDVLVRLLEGAIADKRTTVVFALAQGLADRADPKAVSPTLTTGPDGREIARPAVLVRALDYPDPRVQLVAAIGLLRTPTPPTHGRQARVIEVLSRALAADPPAAGGEMGRALIADPDDFRADRVTALVRRLGYFPERVRSGRELLQRVGRAADFDLIVLDRHITFPELRDVVSQLTASVNTAGRPVLVVASGDVAAPVPFEHVLARLAALVTVTETENLAVSPTFAIDPSRPPMADDEVARLRADIRNTRDRELKALADARVARIRRLLVAADVPTTRDVQDRLDLRIPQLVYALLSAEFPVSAESAPGTVQQIATLTDLLQKRPELAVPLNRVSSAGVARLVEQLNNALDANQRTQLDQLRRRLDIPSLALPPDLARDPGLEDRLARQLGHKPGVAVIPEPFELAGFDQDVLAATADPARMPIDPAQKKTAARYAVDWLRRVALGEVPGYDARPASAALRRALLDPDLADPAVDALAFLPAAENQQDLFGVATTASFPEPLRLKAADRTILHVQKFGRLVPTEAVRRGIGPAVDAATGDLKGKLLVVQQLLAGRTGELVPLMLQLPNNLPQPKAPAPAPAPPAANP